MLGAQRIPDELFRIRPAGLGRRGERTSVADRPKELDRVLSLAVPVSVMLADRDVAVEQILKITSGTILEFDVSSDTELSLNVGGHRIGRGHAVKVGEKFGLRVTRIASVEERIVAMGG